MGRGGSRFGAGRPGWKAKAEHCLKLDIRDFARRKLLGGMSFAWQWTNGETGQPVSSIWINTRAEGIGLSFSIKGQPVSQQIGLVQTKCNFGGTRTWFRCGRCWARVAVLFLRGGNFHCRGCGRIAYASQSEDVLARTWRQQGKVERRLGKDWTRPKGMHRATHERLMNKVIGLELAREDACAALMVKMGLIHF